MHKTKGFTLAEMLIVLIIVGLIAAIAIPEMFKDYQKRYIIANLTRYYRDINMLTQMQGIEGVEISTKTVDASGKKKYTTDEEAMQYFAPLHPTSVKNPEIYYKLLNGEDCEFRICKTNSRDTSANSLLLRDGTYIHVSTHAEDIDYKAFAIDANGKKGPNVLGKDLFAFVIQRDYGLTPLGYQSGGRGSERFGEYNRAVVKSNTQYACNRNAPDAGYWCTALLLMDGWQFKDDYPW